jgi:hypothetical protein
MTVYLIHSSVQIPSNNCLSLQQFKTYFLFQFQAAVFSFMTAPKTSFFYCNLKHCYKHQLCSFDNGILWQLSQLSQLPYHYMKHFKLHQNHWYSIGSAMENQQHQQIMSSSEEGSLTLEANNATHAHGEPHLPLPAPRHCFLQTSWSLCKIVSQ